MTKKTPLYIAGWNKTIGGRKLTTYANILVVDKKDRRNRRTKGDKKPKLSIIMFDQEHYLSHPEKKWSQTFI